MTTDAGFLRPVGSTEVNPIIFLISVAMIVVGITACLRIPEFWRGGERHDRVVKLLLGFGEIQGRAFASVVPIGSFASVLFGALALALFGREITTGPLQYVLEVIATALLPATMLTLLLIFAIVLFGRPKFLIAPPLRAHRGIVGELVARALPSTSDRSRRE